MITVTYTKRFIDGPLCGLTVPASVRTETVSDACRFASQLRLGTANDLLTRDAYRAENIQVFGDNGVEYL